METKTNIMNFHNDKQSNVMIVIGGHGIGKTQKTLECVSKYISADGKQKKVLIFDVNEEFTNESLINRGVEYNIQLLDIKDISSFSDQDRVEVKRILARDENGNVLDIDGKRELLQIIFENYNNGLLVVEDPDSYMLGSKADNTYDILCCNRSKKLDVIIHFQTYRSVTHRLIQNCALYRLHNNYDSIYRHNSKFCNPEIHAIAFKIIKLKCQNNRYFFLYLDEEQMKIAGDFTKDEFILGCNHYQEENPRIIVDSNQLVEKYYGNNN